MRDDHVALGVGARPPRFLCFNFSLVAPEWPYTRCCFISAVESCTVLHSRSSFALWYAWSGIRVLYVVSTWSWVAKNKECVIRRTGRLSI